MVHLLTFSFGLLIGSFLNVVIYRLPRQQSVVFPPSHCPKCDTNLTAGDLVPLLSWLKLKGRCRYCSGGIPIRYPLTELFTAIIFYLLSFYFTGWHLAGMLTLAAVLIAAAVIDYDHGIIPNKLVLAGLTAGCLFVILNPWLGRVSHIFGFLIGGGVLLALAVISRGGMGGGDIKLTAMIGLFLGPKLVLTAVVLAAFLGGGGGLILIASGKKGRKDAMVFGPFLAAGALISLLWGQQLLAWYFSTW